MPYLVRLLLTVPVVWASLSTSDQPGAHQSDAQAKFAASTATDENEGQGEELLGSGFGKFIFIAGGEFTMGRDDGENPDERPEHLVELSSFYVGRTPVTTSQFVRFLNEASVPPKEYLYAGVKFLTPNIERAGDEWICSEGCENDAASCESWVLAEKYCDWLSAKTGRKCRLPTEAEWEYVCRGKEGRKFPWGNDMTKPGRKFWGWDGWKAGKPNLIPVGQFPEGASPEGVCDMIGYMDEVCSDWYDPEYYAESPRNNPAGPAHSLESSRYKDAKVVRGGLERPYVSGSFVVRFFRDSEFFGVLPNHYLPRGWTRGKATPPKGKRFVYGRLGFRVAVEEEQAEKHEYRNAPVRHPLISSASPHPL